jgi:fatty-acyl-CoA synthase
VTRQPGRHDGLLIIDVQNDFCTGGTLAVPDSDRVVSALNGYIDQAVAAGMTIYASRDWHPAVTSHFKACGGEWPAHCVQGTDGARFHPDLRLPSTTTVITKGENPKSPGYSAFEGHAAGGAPFLDELRERGIDRLYVAGLATDICVKHSVIDARAAGLNVTVLEDAIAGVDAQPGDSARAIGEMRKSGAEVVTSCGSFIDGPLTQPATGRVVDDRVLDIVAGLVRELTGGAARRPNLDDSLDRDLGISSLERVELLLRLDHAFGVRLPDSVMAEAVTPRDLVTALLHAAPPAGEEVPTVRQGTTPTTSIPAEARSLVEALRWHAEHTPERIHLHLRNEDGTETPITYGELVVASSAVAGGLRALGVSRGDRVALMLRTERAFFEVFSGALMIGAVPVPLYPPIRAEDLLAYTHRQQAILRNAEARVLVTFGEAERLAALMRGQVPSLDAVTTMGRLFKPGTEPIVEAPSPDEPALIQYTSGSTGDPKGVLLSHANILANVRALGEALEIRSDDVCVSWLPLYHDMGLIGLWLGALYFGVPASIMSPLAFLSRPSRWPWAIHSHRATISAAPNFAFDLCARRVTDDEIQALDLSSWRVAVNGSEAVSPDTIDRFTRRFAPYGFKADAMCPAYGLAESSVALTLGPIRRAARVDRIAREPFERARELRPVSSDDARALRFVSCGRPLPGHRVRIVDASGRSIGERSEGRIQFCGPSVTRGYFRNADATRAAVHDGWMNSGDLGYQAEGELFVTGREKDLIIQGGRNICAEEVEALTSCVPGIRPSCVAAFGIPDAAAGTERVVVVAETRERNAAQREALKRAVRDRVVTGIGSPPDVVVIADPRTVLKTSSGKIRRSAMREAYLRGTLDAHRSVAGQRARLLASAFGAWTRRFAGWLGRAIFTGWILLVLCVSLPVLWACLAVRRPGPQANRAAKRWSRLALTSSGLRPRVVGLDHLRTLHSGILVANHASYIDPIVLMAAIPGEFHFIAKRALADYRLIGTVIRKAEHITIEKAALSDRLAGAEQVALGLRGGEPLMIFPEGTFVRAPGLLPFRLGAFRAAVDAGRPIVPIAIHGTRHVLPDGTWLFRHGTITVTIGAPMDPQAQGWPEMVRLRDAAVEVISRGCGESLSAGPTAG